MVANGRSTLNVRDLFRITVTLRTSLTSLTNALPEAPFRSAAPARSMAWLHVSAAAAIAPRASSFRQDFREPRTPPILFAPFAAIAAFRTPCPLAGAPHPGKPTD